jgi:hypothetical protein
MRTMANDIRQQPETLYQMFVDLSDWFLSLQENQSIVIKIRLFKISICRSVLRVFENQLSLFFNYVSRYDHQYVFQKEEEKKNLDEDVCLERERKSICMFFVS